MSRDDCLPHDDHTWLRAALDAAGVGTWRHDLTTGLVQLDPRAQQHYGVSRGELPMPELLDRIHPDDRARLEGEIATVIGEQHHDHYVTEYRTVDPQGHVRHLRVHVRLEFGPDRDGRPVLRGVGTTQDITTARADQRLLEEQALLLQEVEDIAQVGGWDFDPRTGEGRWTRGTLAIHGLTEPPSAANSGLERFEGDARARIEAALAEASTRGTPYDLELPFTAVNGERKWVRAVCRPVLDGARVVRLRGTLQDITAQKRSEAALQRFMQASPTIIYALAIEGDGQRLVRLEGDIERLTGWKTSEVDAGDWWRRNIHPDDLARVLAQNPAPYDLEHLTIDFRFRRADGRYMWLHDERRLIRDAGGRPSEVVGSWSDVTERVELEMQLRQSQKLEAIGQLAGGIAHDFNNLMTVVIGTSDILDGMLPPDPALASLVEDIRVAGERAANLTRQLLAFSRTQVLQPAAVDVNSAVRGLDRILRRLIGEDITVACEAGDGVGHVIVDAGQLEQVLINLAVNARDAMPHGGTLTITTSVVDGTAIAGALPVPHACIAITDTGHGMPEEVLQRIFEPFFTTKPVGRGTGLGLAVVFGIVRQSGGHITVESTPGAGTTFRIFLPRTAAPRVAPHAAPESLRGSETVMVVDDEDGVRRVAAVVLARHGYRVIEASSPDDALAKAAAGLPLDLLLTDVVMPGMNGPALAEALRARHPRLKVLFMSGYVDDALDRHGLEQLQQSLLMKPFTPRELAARIRRALDDQGS